ncbi:MAG: hypothetical protein WAV91_09120, partial [Aquabacterium sp.]
VLRGESQGKGPSEVAGEDASESSQATLSRTERLLQAQLTLALRLMPPLRDEVRRLSGRVAL